MNDTATESDDPTSMVDFHVRIRRSAITALERIANAESVRTDRRVHVADLIRTSIRRLINESASDPRSGARVTTTSEP